MPKPHQRLQAPETDDIAYEERILLFIDFLGFKDIVEQTAEDPLRLVSLVKAMSTLGELKDEYGVFASEQMSQFSDCVALSYRATETSGVFYLLNSMALAIVDLAARGYLVRGAVTVGPLYHTPEHLVGPAMVTAYEMESTLAIYPRVIVDHAIFRFARKHRSPNHNPNDEMKYVRDLIRKDDDGQWFCDYVSWKSVVGAFGLEDEAYDLLRAAFDSVELDLRKLCEIVRKDQFEVARHERRAIANRQSALEAVTHVLCCGLKILHVGDDAAGLLDHHASIFRNLGAPRCPFEELDSEPDLHVLHLSAQGRLLQVQFRRSARKTQAVCS
jgi:hypothetical protein